MITLLGKPVTKKNSSQVIVVGKYPAHRTLIIPSKAYLKYEKECLKQLKTCKQQYEGVKLEVACKYWLADARKCDLTNLLAASHDILETAKIIDDDGNIVSVDGSRILGIDQKNPRVEIYIKVVE